MSATTTSRSKRVAKNTLILYIRLCVLMLISLFTTRVTLNALGVDDYGIYNVVGGLVTLFSLFSGSMTAATSRFISYSLGTGNQKDLGKVFSTTINIHALLALGLVVAIEIAGGWFLENKMIITPGRMDAAKWVLQCSIISFAIGIMFLPYNACIVAHEHMSAFAYMTIIDGISKLVLASAVYFYGGDKLILYSTLALLFSCIVQLLYRRYCKKHFQECRYKFVWDKSLNKKIFSFSGWNFIGAASGVLKDQGVNILINLFCGTAVNAARSIAMQVNSVVSQFVQNFMMALNPQITKSFAGGDRDYTMQLVFQGSRYSFYLLLLLSLPILMEADILLRTWLGIIPMHTISFVRLILIYNLIESLSYTMVTLMLANGKIRNYQLVVGGCQMLNFPLCYIFLYLGYSPEVTLIISIVVAVMCMILRLIMLKKMVAFPISSFIRKVLFNVCKVLVVAAILPTLLTLMMDDGWVRLLLGSFLCIVSVIVSVWFIGCTKTERGYLLQLLKNKFCHAKR